MSSSATESREARFEALFADSYPALYRFAARRVGEAAADDIVSEVFVAAWRAGDGTDHVPERLWLFGVARNIAASYARSSARHNALQDRLRSEIVFSRPGDPAQAIADTALVRQAITQLPGPLHEALVLVDWDGFGVGEAAAIAGCRPSTFRVRLFRARTTVRQAIESQSAPDAATNSSRRAT